MEMKTPILSVTIPVCERTAYLAGCLASVVAADPGDGSLEIKVIDNASSNREEVAAIVARCPGVELVRHEERVVISASYNRCLVAAKGAWIHLLHDDDEVSPGFYEEVLKCANDPASADAGLIVCRTVIIDGNGNPVAGRKAGIMSPQTREQLLLYSLGSSPFWCPSVVISARVIQTGLWFDEEFQIINDWDYWWRVLLRFPVAYALSSAARYRVHTLNTHKNAVYHRYFKRERPWLIARLVQEAEASGLDPASWRPDSLEYRQLARRMVHFCLLREFRIAAKLMLVSPKFGFSRVKLSGHLFAQGLRAVPLFLFDRRVGFVNYLEGND